MISKSLGQGGGVECLQKRHLVAGDYFAITHHRRRQSKVAGPRLYFKIGAIALYYDFAKRAVILLNFRRVGDLVVSLNILVQAAQRSSQVVSVGDQEAAGRIGKFRQGDLGVGAAAFDSCIEDRRLVARDGFVAGRLGLAAGRIGRGVQHVGGARVTARAHPVSIE